MRDKLIYKDSTYSTMNTSNVLFSPLHEDTDKSKSIIIYLTPKPKQRPRFTSNGHTYTPKETLEYERLIATAWHLQHKTIMTGYLKMDLKFFMPIPKSWSKKKREQAIKGEIRPDTTPDLDNLVKAVSDALNERAFWDDRQIVDSHNEEWYAEIPRIEITITELT